MKIRQGCVLLIFNIYLECIFREALVEVVEEITLRGERMSNIRYADNTLTFVDHMAGKIITPY